MQEVPGIDGVRVLLNQFASQGMLYSTGAKVVYFSQDLYNVSGSTHDPMQVPNYESKAWTQLLKLKAGLTDRDNCYVTNEVPPAGTTHPEFSVGGHMTTDDKGRVKKGGTCYLMPLCKWHNSSHRNGVRYEHSKTKMLRLTGYMEGESAITFQLRQPSDKQYALLYFDMSDQEWKYENLAREHAHNSFRAKDVNNSRQFQILLERSSGDMPELFVKECTLPNFEGVATPDE